MRPLSDTLPLRTTAVWPGYDVIEPIPVALGRTSLTPVQFGAGRRLWAVSDYPVMGIDAVRIDDAPTAAYTWWNADDGTGRTVAMLELGQALPDGARLAVDVRGLPDPDTGALLENPADVARWILSTYAGRTITRAQMDDFRVDAANAGLFVSGVLEDDTQTIRAVLDSLFRSVGAVWSGGMPGIAALYPSTRRAGIPVAEVFGDADNEFSATSSADAIITCYVLRFSYDFSAGTYRGAVSGEAPDAVERYGRLTADWDAPWLLDPAAAVALATRLLQYRARPQWRYQWRTTAPAVVGGDWVSVGSWLAPVMGEAFVISTEKDLATDETLVYAEIPAGEVPRVNVTQVSSRLEPEIPQRITTDFVGGVLTITVPSVAGVPIAGAKVTLDGVQTQTTDAMGRCQFIGVAPGAHRVYIQAEGYQPMEYGIRL